MIPAAATHTPDGLISWEPVMLGILAAIACLLYLVWPIISARYHRHIRSSERFADAMKRLAELSEAED